MNRGLIYQQQVANQYSTTPGSSLNENGIDVIINTPIPIKVEVKNPKNGADYGGTKIRWNESTGWYYDSDSEESAEIAKLLEKVNYENVLNEKWKFRSYDLQFVDLLKQKYKNDEGSLRNALRVYRNEAQRGNKQIRENFKNVNFDQAEQILNTISNDHSHEVTTNLSYGSILDAMRSHYSSSDYIQLNGKGLFRLHENRDPLSRMTNGEITVPLFSPVGATVVSRLQSKGSLRKAQYLSALRFTGIQRQTNIRYKNLPINDLIDDHKNFISLFKQISEGAFQNQS